MIDTLADIAHRAGFRWQARREAARLRQAGGTVEQALAEALAAALRATPAPEDAAWIRRIEALRATLLRDDAALTFCDYGAGARRTDPPPEPGREVVRTVRDLCRSAVPPHEGRVLFYLARRFRPARCLELGTCLGLSAAYLGAALALDGAGRLVTLEGGAAPARRAQAHLAHLGLRNVEVVTGRFEATLPAVLHAHGPIDFAFVDGHHDPAALRAYYQCLAPHLAEEAVLVFDDIFWTTGMRRAWTALAAEASMRAVVDLLAFGICFFRR